MGVLSGFHLLEPFPGTEVREEHDRLGIKILTNDWRQYHANRAIVETPTVTPKMLDEIVIEWKDDFDEWLGEIKRHMETGEATEDEVSLLTNLERTVLIYDLMMGRIIEEKGTWRNNGKPFAGPDVLKTLVDRVTRSTRHRSEDIFSSLASAIEHGNLTYEENHGTVRWKWVDYI